MIANNLVWIFTLLEETRQAQVWPLALSHLFSRGNFLNSKTNVEGLLWCKRWCLSCLFMHCCILFSPGKDALLYQLHVLMEKPILPKKKMKAMKLRILWSRHTHVGYVHGLVLASFCVASAVVASCHFLRFSFLEQLQWIYVIYLQEKERFFVMYTWVWWFFKASFIFTGPYFYPDGYIFISLFCCL